MERLTNKTVARLAKATQEGYFVKMGREERLDAQYLVNQSPEHSELYCRLFELEEQVERGELVKLPCNLGDILYQPIYGTPCCTEIKVTELSLTKDGWVINPREYYYFRSGCGIPVKDIERLNLHFDDAIVKAHYKEFYDNQDKYVSY